jgi:hypothetical protein
MKMRSKQNSRMASAQTAQDSAGTQASGRDVTTPCQIADAVGAIVEGLEVMTSKQKKGTGLRGGVRFPLNRRLSV